MWQKLRNEKYPDFNLPQRKADYPTLWAKAVKNTKDVEKVMETIAQASRGYQSNPAVEAILNLRWSLLYTSAIDSAIDSVVSLKGCTLVDSKETNAKHRYLNKDRRYRVDLCGNQECPPPVLGNTRDKKAFWNQIKNKIAWMLEKTKVPNTGCLF